MLGMTPEIVIARAQQQPHDAQDDERADRPAVELRRAEDADGRAPRKAKSRFISDPATQAAIHCSRPKIGLSSQISRGMNVEKTRR